MQNKITIGAVATIVDNVTGEYTLEVFAFGDYDEATDTNTSPLVCDNIYCHVDDEHRMIEYVAMNSTIEMPEYRLIRIAATEETKKDSKPVPTCEDGASTSMPQEETPEWEVYSCNETSVPIVRGDLSDDEAEGYCYPILQNISDEELDSLLEKCNRKGMNVHHPDGGIDLDELEALAEHYGCEVQPKAKE